MKLRHWFQQLRFQVTREEGQTMAEYGLLIAFIALIAVVGVTALGGSLSTFFNTITGQFK
jgi:pilus assembly protein Flp/PilA